MYLHHFAHKLEAKSFLDSTPFKRLESPIGELYQTALGYILVSGEGFLKAFKATSWVLAKFTDITEIINLGVAGSLSDQYKINEIYSVKNCYGQINDSFEFQSLKLKGQINCISTSNRVTSNDQLEKLTPFAHIVDRELYAVAQIASLYKVPVTSYKIISDYAGNQTNCQTVQDLGEQYSQKLFQHYSVHFTKAPNLTRQTPELPEGFHFTDYLKKEYKKLALTMPNLKEITQKIQSMDVEPKKRTTLLIAELKKSKDPITEKARKLLKKHVAPIESLGAKVHFDPQMEKEEITLSIKINSQKNIEDLKLKLSELSFHEVKSILNGEFDV